MGRFARIKILDDEGWYHLYARVTDQKVLYPLAEADCTQKLQTLLEHYARLYKCEMAAFCIMGNHWHAVLRFEAPRAIEERELQKLARDFYPGKMGEKFLSTWQEKDWQRFAARVFDVSEFMRNVQSQFARWYNDTHQRKGHFWADRFGSVLLENERESLACMLYIELNPVRAGIVQLPEKHKASSCSLRTTGKDNWLMDISQLLAGQSERKAREEYRAMLLWRGTKATKENQQTIPEKLVLREEERGYAKRGSCLKRTAHLTEGLVIGDAEYITDHLRKLKENGTYKCRINPIKPEDAPHFALRPQRKH